MAFSSLSTAATAAGAAITQFLLRQIKDNFDFLNGALGTIASITIPNGSFEVDSDANGTPDNWIKTTYPGGSVTLDAATPGHGATGLKMIHPGGAGNGGGYIVSDYVPCAEVIPIILDLIHWSTAAGMKNQIIFYWYTAAKVACATTTTTVYDSTANPTTPTKIHCGAVPPSTARFFKVRLVGGESSVNIAGSAYWDGLSLGAGIHSMTGTTNVFAENLTTETHTLTSMLKVFEVDLWDLGGVVSTSFYLSNTGAGTAYGQIYKNGVAVGTAHTAASATPAKKSDASISVAPGDLLQLYTRNSTSAGSSVAYFRVMSAIPAPYRAARSSLASTVANDSYPK